MKILNNTRSFIDNMDLITAKEPMAKERKNPWNESHDFSKSKDKMISRASNTRELAVEAYKAYTEDMIQEAYELLGGQHVDTQA